MWNSVLNPQGNVPERVASHAGQLEVRGAPQSRFLSLLGGLETLQLLPLPGESVQQLWESRTICPVNHRIMEWFGSEGTLKTIWFQPPCHQQGHLPPAQVAQSSIQPGLEPCQGRGSHSFSGQPGPGPHHPHGEEFLPKISSKSMCFFACEIRLLGTIQPDNATKWQGWWCPFLRMSDPSHRSLRSQDNTGTALDQQISFRLPHL